jgi:hypothetical protein
MKIEFRVSRGFPVSGYWFKVIIWWRRLSIRQSASTGGTHTFLWFAGEFYK